MHKLVNVVDIIDIICVPIEQHSVSLIDDDTFHDLNLASMAVLDHVDLMILFYFVHLEYFVQVYQQHLACVCSHCCDEMMVSTFLGI